MHTTHAQKIAAEVIALYKQKGNADYIGEAISQLEHASQAAQLAIKDGSDDEVILAAFLHDIGHLLDDTPETEQMGGYGVQDHEGLGSAYLLQRGFSNKVAMLVNAHVQAKRYLCAVNQRYYQNLSAASKFTLGYQGGPMTNAEVAAFEQNPLKHLIIKMRTWDEEAKHPNIPLLDLDMLQAKIARHISANTI
jgi:phosphonate degradation associated HDIG domain protein